MALNLRPLALLLTPRLALPPTHSTESSNAHFYPFDSPTVQRKPKAKGKHKAVVAAEGEEQVVVEEEEEGVQQDACGPIDAAVAALRDQSRLAVDSTDRVQARLLYDGRLASK